MYRIFVGKPERKRQLKKAQALMGDNIKMHTNWIERRGLE
jgi:hypothetical protein